MIIDQPKPGKLQRKPALLSGRTVAALATLVRNSRIRIFYLIPVLLLVWAGLPASTLHAQSGDLVDEAKAKMLQATQFMVEEVSVHGGYVRLQTKDLSRRWGELEVFDTQIWVGGNYPLTPGMGKLFLDLYHETGEEYYYEAADKVADALIWGQLESGGWDYIIDFAGTRSKKHWYNTIGQNAWGWFEYNHYYGNATQHSNTTSATRFLLRMYVSKLDPKYKPALDKALDFVLESQFPLGGWSKRYPPTRHHQYEGRPDYTVRYNFHADVPRDNIELLIEAYNVLGEERFLDPIRRGMNFFIIAQQGNPQGGWARHLDENLEPAFGRPFEPAGISTRLTATHIRIMLRFYQYTGDRKFLARIPDAIDWLRRSKLPEHMTNDGNRTHALVMEVGTNKPLWNHRRGTGVLDGEYIVNYDYEGVDGKIYAYGDNIRIDVDELEREYERVAAMSPEEASRNSPLNVERYEGMEPPQRYLEYQHNYKYYDPTPGPRYTAPSESGVRQILEDLDGQGRWITTGEWISDPYTLDEDGNPSNTAMHSDPITATWITDDSDQEYISNRVYIDNMRQLLEFIKQESDR